MRVGAPAGIPGRKQALRVGGDAGVPQDQRTQTRGARRRALRHRHLRGHERDRHRSSRGVDQGARLMALLSCPSLSYRLGLAVLRGVAPSDAPLWLVHDPRLDALVAPGHRMAELRSWALEHDVAESGGVPEDLDAPLLDPRTPRPYQREAVDRWRAAGARGSVVLPTGAGKTLVALMAINE